MYQSMFYMLMMMLPSLDDDDDVVLGYVSRIPFSLRGSVEIL
jgi:hypothetical protein